MRLSLRRSPYWPVFTDPILKRVLPGIFVSDLGDGMSMVAISWLALQLAPPTQQALWVSVALAANTLPGVIGTVLLTRWLKGRSGAQLAGWEATLRAICLGAVPIMYATNILTLPIFVATLTVSAILTAWGGAGRFLVFTESLPEEHHITANAVSTTATELSTILGPLLAAALITLIGAPATIGVDAATYAVLALTYRLAVPRTGAVQKPDTKGFSVIWHNPKLLGLLGLTIGYYVIFGPVLVALPVHISTDLHESATTLALYYTVFGIGSVTGGILTPYLRRLPVWPITIGTVFLFGLSLVPFGLNVPTTLALVGFAFGGLFWAPYVPVSTTLFQREASPAVLAARGAFATVATPFGSLVGGPIVAAIGAKATLLASGVSTMALGVVAAAIVLTRRQWRKS